MTTVPAALTYTIVVREEIVRIDLTLADLNGLQVKVGGASQPLLGKRPGLS